MAPGELIRETLEERGITQVDFALRLGKSEKFVSQLVNGKASLSYDTAIELERVLGVPSSTWNNWESIYRDALVRIRGEAEAVEQAEELYSYFGVSSIEAYQEYWSSEKRLAARMSTAYTAETPAITAWLREGERAAEAIPTAPYKEPVFREVLTELRSATRLAPNEWQPLIVDRCATAGVVVVFVPDLPKTRCHAVSWWATRTRAVIQLGLRYKTDDQVWFSLFHEAGHILLDDRTRTRIIDLNGDEAIEARANEFAADFLIPAEEYRALVARGRPSKAAVVAFANRLGIAPSIVVGRLQRDEVIPRDWLNGLKTRVDWAQAAE